MVPGPHPASGDRVDRARVPWSHYPHRMTTGPATRWADRAIAVYQRRISPRKGYSCAHRVAHGGDSCSQAVRRSLLERGVLRAVLPSATRFLACYRAVSLLSPQQRVEGVCCCGPIPIPFGFGGR